MKRHPVGVVLALACVLLLFMMQSCSSSLVTLGKDVYKRQVMDEAAMAEMRRLIFEAPIQELADAQGISMDEAVQLRVEKNLEAAEVPIEAVSYTHLPDL